MSARRIPYPKFGVGTGAARLGAIAEELGISLRSFGAGGAVIVGTNGKGSTAAMTASLLRATGARVGLFTSPHLLDLNERFRIGDSDIDDADLDDHWTRVADAARACRHDEALGGFEFLFLIAASWFASRCCDHTVWEAGIGGRFDPVRLIEARRIALTSLDLEHTALLGSTLEDIARDKLDAAPRGAKVFVGASCAPQIIAIEQHCGEHGLAAAWPGALAGSAPLRGGYQAENAALALSLAEDCMGAPLSQDVISRGFAATRWPGRLEKLSEEPLVVVDAGHTPRAISLALEGFLRIAAGREAVLICGASRDKDIHAIIGRLAPRFATIVCTSVAHRGASVEDIVSAATAANPGARVHRASTVVEARTLAQQLAGQRPVYVAGGLFLAAEFKALWEGRDPASLVFF